MFNKRETNESNTSNRSELERPETEQMTATLAARSAKGTSTTTASIGPSISVDGTLKGEEDLVVDGRIKGTVELKSHTLTVGSEGKLDAEIYAHTIFVQGTVNGDLYASERITICKTAQVEGNILAPRISLEDGAKFRGSIDMDADSEAFRKAFGKKSTTASPATPSRGSGSAGDASGKSRDPIQQDSKNEKPGSGPQSGASGNVTGTSASKTGTSAA